MQSALLCVGNGVWDSIPDHIHSCRRKTGMRPCFYRFISSGLGYVILCCYGSILFVYVLCDLLCYGSLSFLFHLFVSFYYYFSSISYGMSLALVFLYSVLFYLFSAVYSVLFYSV